MRHLAWMAVLLAACGDPADLGTPDASVDAPVAPVFRNAVAMPDAELANPTTFPHFRSDGWIYAQVRDANTEHEYTIATDAALRAE